MGVHWAASLMYWKPHVRPDGTAFDLAHVHPFRFYVDFAEDKGRPARSIEVQVGFSTHVFTRSEHPAEAHPELYDYDRERRVFDLERYTLAFRLRDVLLNLKKCFFASGTSFLTIRGDGVPVGFEYAVFFSVRRIGTDMLELIVRSAYLERIGDAPRGRKDKPIGFRVIALNTADGKACKRPP